MPEFSVLLTSSEHRTQYGPFHGVLASVPPTTPRRALAAHELAHVVQQSAARIPIWDKSQELRSGKFAVGAERRQPGFVHGGQRGQPGLAHNESDLVFIRGRCNLVYLQLWKSSGRSHRLTLAVLDSANRTIARYTLQNAWPLSWQVGSSASGSDVMMEKITLVHEGMSRH